MTTGMATVLYVEDDPDHAELVLRALARATPPPAVVHHGDGESALGWLETTARRPDLILLDLRLPRLDGLELLTRLKADARFASIPVVILTTSNNPGDVSAAYEHHANSYLVKPTDYGALSRLMQDLSAYWVQWNVRAS
jgi:CheY-like chemotaxis protein